MKKSIRWGIAASQILLCMISHTAFSQSVNYSVNWVGNTFNGRNNRHVQNFIEQLQVQPDGTCYTSSGWDEAHWEYGVYKNGEVLRTQNYNINTKQIIINGDTWKVENTVPCNEFNVHCTPYGTSVVKVGTSTRLYFDRVTALGKDHSGNTLMVCDDSPGQHVIKFYDITGSTPQLVKTFGTVGGIGAGTPGEVTPHKFWQVSGCGRDLNGNIYVGMNLEGGGIRCFNPDESLKWEVLGLNFIDCGAVDPASDGTEIYQYTEHYQVDFSKPVGYYDNRESVKLKGWLWDSDKYPTHPMAKYKSVDGAGSFQLKRLNGNRLYMFANIAMNNAALYITEIDGEELKLGYNFSDRYSGAHGDARYVDDDGNIWNASGTTVSKFPITGFGADGLPTYGSKIDYSVPSVNSIQRFVYFPSGDYAIITHNPHPDDWGRIGQNACRINNLTTNPEKVWDVDIKQKGLIEAGKGEGKAIDAVGDYLFVALLEYQIDIYKLSDGGLVGQMYGDKNDELGFKSWGDIPWVDIKYGIQGFKRTNGEYLILQEDDVYGKGVIYRWTPTGTTSSCDTIKVTGFKLDKNTETINGSETKQLVAAILPVSACRKITWKSLDPSIVNVNTSGLITGIKPGTCRIVASIENGSFSDTCVVTVNDIPVTAIVLDSHSLTISPSKFAALVATLLPANALNKRVIWVSLTDTVASVDSLGIVKALKPGVTYIVATSENGNFSDTCMVTVPNVIRFPYGGVARSIPGKIEAEDYDEGLDGLSYYDTEAANFGGKYRLTEGVDIETCSDLGAGFNVGWTDKDEWLLYFVNVDAGIYDITTRVAVAEAKSSCSILLDDTLLGNFELPVTGGYQTWKDVTKFDIPVNGGNNKTLKLLLNSSGFNINYLNFVKSIPVETFSLNTDTLKLKPKGTYTFIANVLPTNTTRAGVDWLSGNTNLFTVTSLGKISAKSLIGQAYLYAKSVDGIHLDSCLVQVGNFTGIESAVSSQIHVFPNPSNGNEVTVSGLSGEATIEICDLSGKKLFNKIVNASGTVTLNNLNLYSGFYLIDIKNKGFKTVFKLIVE